MQPNIGTKRYAIWYNLIKPSRSGMAAVDGIAVGSIENCGDIVVVECIEELIQELEINSVTFAGQTVDVSNS